MFPLLLRSLCARHATDAGLDTARSSAIRLRMADSDASKNPRRRHGSDIAPRAAVPESGSASDGSPLATGDEVLESQAYFVVKGRRWRASDPRIPEGLRVALVTELMSARRAVRAAKDQNPEILRVARARVQDAKVALGERGPTWWGRTTENATRERIVACIRALSRARGADKSLCPSEVARAQGPEDWRKLMPLVRAVAFELRDAGELSVTQKGREVDRDARGAIRLQLVND